MSEPTQPYAFSTHTTDFDPGIRDAMDGLRAKKLQLEQELGILIQEKLAAFRTRTGVMIDAVSVDIVESREFQDKEPRPAAAYARVVLRI
jgi:hypothetical protein